MKRFRLPRKLKKTLKRGFWLYPEKNGGFLQASPAKNEQDYKAMKEGIVTNHFPVRSKKSRKEAREEMNRPITIPDEELRTYVNGIFRETYKRYAYQTLIRAKNNPKAVKAYYQFVNACKKEENGGGDMGNVCCLCVEYARDLLKGK